MFPTMFQMLYTSDILYYCISKAILEYFYCCLHVTEEKAETLRHYLTCYAGFKYAHIFFDTFPL